MTFFFPKSAAYFGLALAKYASGTNDLTGCTPEDDIHAVTGYEEHHAFWESWQKLHAEQ